MSNCSCSIDVYDAEPCEFANSRYYMAKKEHKCDECGCIIKPGELYEYISGKFDGDFFIHKTCDSCESVRNEYFCSYIYGGIWEHLIQEIYDNPDDINWGSLNNISKKARDKIVEIIQEAWDNMEDQNVRQKL